jgi:hypothetical protein
MGQKKNSYRGLKESCRLENLCNITIDPEKTGLRRAD